MGYQYTSLLFYFAEKKSRKMIKKCHFYIALATSYDVLLSVEWGAFYQRLLAK